MTARTSDTDVAAALAYPSQRDTAAMLGISETTLSKRDDDTVPVGDRGKHYRPSEALRLAAIYRRRTLNEVAADLLAHVRANSPADEETVRREIDDYFASVEPPRVDRDRFLEEARRTLPRRLYEQVERAYEGERRTTRVSTGGQPAPATVRHA